MKEKICETARELARRKLSEMLLHLFYLSVFSLIVYLYGAPMEAILYAVEICLAMGTAVRIVQFFLIYQRHADFAAAERSELLLPEIVPRPRGLIERDYAACIDRLMRERAEIVDKNDRGRRDAADYYATWVHQIKNPISAMRLLLQGEDTSLGRSLKSELFRIEQYVEMVLIYVRMGGDSSDYIIKKYGLGKLVRQAVRKFSTVFISKKIALHLGEIHAEIITDEKWLSFVIEQVLSNALKYTKSGSVSIHAREDGEGVELRISDTGIGIAAEDLPRVFDKGFTGYNGRLDKRATGLGLYLSKEICNRLGHSMEITSRSGEGTTVCIGFRAENVPLD